MNKVRRSSAFALAFGYIAFGIVALVLFAAPLWYAWHVTIAAGRAEILQEDAQRLVTVFRHEGVDGLKAFMNARVGMQIANERILLLTDPQLRRLAGNLAAWPTGVSAKPGTYTVRVTLGGHAAYAVFVHALLPGGYNLLVGRDLARFVPLEMRFWYGLAGAVAILSIVGIVGGFLVRRVLLLRIDSIRHTVSAIMQGDLSHRLPTGDHADEFDTLSRTINRMLDQIEQLVDGIREVSNTIAHDLRTPLAELRARLEELSLVRPPTEETFAEIEAAVGDVDRVIGIFNALLRLAEIDSGLRRSGFVAVDAAEVAAAAAEFYLPAAELKAVTLSFRDNGPAPIAGDPLLLAQAVGNLIDNALKYTPNDGTIVVEAVRRADGVVEIAVSDNGPGITADEMPKATGRFYRGDASRGTPGVGLGLSIVEAVTRLHGGALNLSDNRSGLHARMVFPPDFVGGGALASLPDRLPASAWRC